MDRNIADIAPTKQHFTFDYLMKNGIVTEWSVEETPQSGCYYTNTFIVSFTIGTKFRGNVQHTNQDCCIDLAIKAIENIYNEILEH
jgi:hypothetical protein